MKLLVGIAVGIMGCGLAVSQTKKPVPKITVVISDRTPPVDAFETTFNTQVDKTNEAAKAFIEIQCNDANYSDVETEFYTQLAALVDIYKKIPDDQDALIRVREIEMYFGVTYLSQDAIKADAKVCKKHGQDEHDSKTETAKGR